MDSDSSLFDITIPLDSFGKEQKSVHASLFPLLVSLTHKSDDLDQDFRTLLEIKKIVSTMITEPFLKIKSQELRQLTKKMELDVTFYDLFGITRLNSQKATVYRLDVKKFLLGTSLNIANDKEGDDNHERKAELAFEFADLDGDGFISFQDLREMMVGFNSFNGLCFDDESITKICSYVYSQMINCPSREELISKLAFTGFILALRRRETMVQKSPKKKREESSSAWQKLCNYISTERNAIICFIALMLMNAGVSAYYFTQDRFGFPARSVTRQMAGQINLNSALLLLTISKNFQTFIHQTFLRRFFLIHKNIKFHRYIATWIFITGIIHSIFHLAGTFPYIASLTLDELNEKVAYHPPLTVVPTYKWLLLSSIPGKTGLVLMVLMFFIAVTIFEKIRRKNYEVFWYTHHLYIAIYFFLAVHGSQELAAKQIFQYFFAVPGVIFVLEKLSKLYRIFAYKNRAISINLLSSGIVELVIPRPRYFTYRSGQYASVNIPDIRRLQWHAFTISSSPIQQDIISFHISPVGNWTNKLAEMAKMNLTGDQLPAVLIDGPFGTPSEQFHDYKNIMLICSGIGATPFASVLRELLHRVKTDTNGLMIQSLDFCWVNRKSSQLTWLVTIFQSLLKEQFALGSTFLKINLYFTGDSEKRDFRSLFLWDAIETLKKKGELKKHCYCSNVYSGRPDWNSIFKQKSEQEDGASEIGVFLCGNKAMAADVLTQCKKYSTNKTFKFKNEVF